MGYPGDSVFDKPDSIQRPAFTKNGTFMVFRKLEQDVCGFEKYVEDRRGSDSSELFAAKMVGRFKSVCFQVRSSHFILRKLYQGSSSRLDTP
jgi:hypothetical protein